MTLEEMQRRKKELGLTNEEIAARSGLSVPTVQRILSGTTKNPQGWNKEFIEAVLMEGCDLSVHEDQGYSYRSKKQGEYTIRDYFMFPDECRCEIIDGTVYEREPSTLIHQEIVGEIGYQLKNYARNNKISCMVMMMPLDCALEDKTVVQPDVFVACDFENKDRIGHPVPTFAVEVVSPDSAEKDYLLKLEKYNNTGIREYWIIDYKNESIIAYTLGEGFNVKFYGLYDKIPVSIWDGKCVIDLSILKEDLPKLEGVKIGF